MSDPIARLNAALEGRYRIDRELGEGGMATLYVAEDLRHERSVAFKVLQPELAAVVGAERFLAEIKTTAHLQHPHILPLFDSGEADGLIYYVMPYVEGETLWDRIESEKQLPVDEAIQIATAILSALDYAHRKGVVHRDIKPANILMQDGQAVVADFGIALAVSAAGAGRITETGLSVGTPHYMSPEQATGDQTVGPATDIYALGCVLYEMLVGEPPYTGSTPQAILAKIITKEPEPVSAQRKSVPLNVDAAIAKALERVPADRFASAQEMASALASPTFQHEQAEGATIAAVSRSWNRLTAGLTVTTVVLAGALVLWNVWGSGAGGLLEISDAPSGPQRYVVELPDNASYVAYGDLAVTRDGETLVYTALTNGRVELFTRPLGAPESSPLSIPTDGAAYAPFLSPDGEWIGFFTGRRVGDQSRWSLYKIPVGGGRPTPLAENARRYNGTWTDDGYLVYTGGGDGFTSTGLYRVPEQGGDPERLTLALISNQELAHHTPFALPEGRGVLFRIERTDTTSQTAVWSAETGQYRALPDVGTGYPVKYIGTGHILFPEAGSLMAIAFDLDSLVTVGRPFPVVDDMQTLENPGQSYASFTVSEAGLLIYAPGGPIVRSPNPTRPSLLWVRPDGGQEPLPTAPDSYGFPRVSPSGDRVAAIIYEGIERADIWVLDVNTGARIKLTNGGFNRLPMWAPDGQYVFYSSDVGMERPQELGPNAFFGNIWRAAADGSTAPERLVTSDQNQAISGITPDGSVVYTALSERNTRREIWTLSATDGEIRPIVDGPAMYGNGSVSPDGRWLAHSSDETGNFEIYVQAYPGGGAKAPISVGGGSWVTWSADGQELYYRLGSAMMAVGFDTTTGRATGPPTELFRGGYSQANTGRAYDRTPDGRFVMIGMPRGFRPTEPSEPLTSESLVAIVNFFDEVRSRAAN